jgi:hypothetical protein
MFRRRESNESKMRDFATDMNLAHHSEALGAASAEPRRGDGAADHPSRRAFGAHLG